jgi:PAS domain-containing protein
VTLLTIPALAHVVEQMPAPVVLIDQHGFITRASQLAATRLGLALAPEDVHLDQYLVLSGGSLTVEHRAPIQTDDGETFTLVALAGPLAPPPPKDVAALAGAVAHDFNNLLGVILNFATLAAATVAPGSAAASDLREVLTATQRAATIAQRLQELGDVRTPGRFAESSDPA